jgi:hypothetical protein
MKRLPLCRDVVALHVGIHGNPHGRYVIRLSEQGDSEAGEQKLQHDAMLPRSGANRIEN